MTVLVRVKFGTPSLQVSDVQAARFTVYDGPLELSRSPLQPSRAGEKQETDSVLCLCSKDVAVRLGAVLVTLCADY